MASRYYLLGRAIPAMEDRPGRFTVLVEGGRWEEIPAIDMLRDHRSPEVSLSEFKRALAQRGARMPGDAAPGAVRNGAT